MWEHIARTIATDREVASPVEVPAADNELAAQRARRTRARWIAPVAVAAAIAMVLLAAQVSSLRGQLDRSHRVGTTAMAAAFDRAAKTRGAQEVGLQSGSGATLARIVLLPDGAGYLRGDKLAPLPPNRTYQLWAVTGTGAKPTVVSAGVLGPDPSAIAFHRFGLVEECRNAQHDRHDGVNARADAVPHRHQTLAEITGVDHQPVAQGALA